MNRLFPLLLVAILFLSPACRAAGEAALTVPTERLVIADGGGKQHLFDVELALTPEEQMRGLMFREELADDGGMLFVFPDEQHRAFWMKNTLVPLDMVFIRADGT